MRSEPKRFREKPRVVEARLFDGTSTEMMEVVGWVKDNGYVWYELFTPAPANGITIDPDTGFLGIMSTKGLEFAEKGDWLYKDVTGEIRPSKPEVFAATYEEIGSETEIVVPIEPSPSTQPTTPPTVAPTRPGKGNQPTSDPAVTTSEEMSGVDEPNV